MRTRVMGILNATPDSFSDGGLFAGRDAAIGAAEQMTADGADLIDVGGESTRPGADEIPAEVQIRRIVPVIEAIAGLGVPVSVDTRSPVVAAAALDAGATIVNDVSAGVHDPAILGVVAEHDAQVVLMHMRGTPKTMDSQTTYEDVAAEVRAELDERVSAALDAGVKRDRIMLDPGLGFAKTPEQSLELLRRIGELQDSGFPLLVGPSRKRFVGHVLGTRANDRLEGTLAAVAWCAVHCVDIVRVHDVKPARRVVDMIAAIVGSA